MSSGKRWLMVGGGGLLVVLGLIGLIRAAALSSVFYTDVMENSVLQMIAALIAVLGGATLVAGIRAIRGLQGPWTLAGTVAAAPTAVLIIDGGAVSDPGILVIVPPLLAIGAIVLVALGGSPTD